MPSSNPAPFPGGRISPVFAPPAAPAILERHHGRSDFACVIAPTNAAEIPDVSTAEERRRTAPVDRGFLVEGHPEALSEVPRTHTGPPCPVTIAWAAVQLDPETAAGYSSKGTDRAALPTEIEETARGHHP